MSTKDFGLALLITAILGVNFSVIKIGLSSLDPFTLSGLRFLLCAFPLVFFIKKPIFGLLGSFLIFNEQIGSEKIIAGVLIMTGLLISTFRSPLLIRYSFW
ncbi:MAG TPA: hypothetical protein EYG71_07935 [Leucothrix sp.]|nr:hypothetical protein [Leucothrix sp.]